MKILHKILCLPVILMALAFTACDRDYDMPPLNEPKFELPALITELQKILSR